MILFTYKYRGDRMKKLLLVISLLIILLVTSCSTTGQIHSDYDYSLDDIITTYAGSFKGKDIDIKTTAEFNNVTRNLDIYSNFNIIITNKTNKVIYLDYNKSVYSDLTGSKKLIDGNIRKIDAYQQQPLVPIAPNSSIDTQAFILEPTFGYGDNSQLYLAISNINSSATTHYKISLECKSIDTNKSIEKIGTVSLEENVWHFFFTKDTEKAIFEKLEKKAKSKYNLQAKIYNIQYEKGWSPLSLVLYFDIFGYVDKVKATADVGIPID